MNLFFHSEKQVNEVEHEIILIQNENEQAELE